MLLGLVLNADQGMVAGATVGDSASQVFLDRIDGVLRHGAINGPFSPQHADQATLTVDFYFIVSDKMLCITRIPRSN